MAVCKSINCGNKLPVHGRRAHCANCRARMGWWAKKSAGEIVRYSKRLARNVYRMEHIADRKLDQVEAEARRPAMTIRSANVRARP